MKLRLKGAQKGHSLLKKKADALTLRFRQILAKIIEVRQLDVRLTQTESERRWSAKCGTPVREYHLTVIRGNGKTGFVRDQWPGGLCTLYSSHRSRV